MPPRPTETNALRSWPARVPVAGLWSAQQPPLLGRPDSVSLWRSGTGWNTLGSSNPDLPDRDEEPLAAIERVWGKSRQNSQNAHRGWLVCLSYDLGRRLEPSAQHERPPADDRDHPDIVLVRMSAEATPPNLETPRTYALEEPDTEAAHAEYTGAVAQALGRIRAGEIYQVNLTHRLTSAFSGSARAFASDLLESARPWHGAYLEFDEYETRRAIISASPELFLDADLNTGRVRTRPMKGTRPAEGDPEELRRAPKDRAELDMITDLMRNDLGRVCALGSVRVTDPRVIERHDSGVLQATSSVEGTLREGVGFADLIRATFPPGSVTGAPKIRAMRVIDELELHMRGPYCGACGFLSDNGLLTLGVSIRTAVITGRPGAVALDEIECGALDYGVGAGIVSDSDPEAEWAESLVKARTLLAIAGAERHAQASR